MSLMDALGCAVTPQPGLHGRFSQLAANESVSALIARVALPLDRTVQRATGGRQTATSLVSGFPLLWVTATGVKSLQPRTVPLLGIPTPSRNLALIGTNFGRERTPGWVHNLLAHPEATAEWRDNRADVMAVQLQAKEQEPIWEAAIAAFPAYANYRRWAAHRTIQVFELVGRDG